MEQWRPIAGCAGYEVSDEGRVRSIDRMTLGGPGNRCHRSIKGQVLSLRTDRAGYQRVRIQRKVRAVHHLVLEAFVEPRPTPKAETRHLNGDRADNRPLNLAWGDRLSNAADKREHGTHNNTQRQTCRRRGHDLVLPNLDTGKWAAGIRRCRACYVGYAIMLDHRCKGIYLDRDVIADQLYASFMEGAPDPRKTPGLLALAEVDAPQDVVIEDGRLRGQAPTTRWALRKAFAEGDEFGMAEAMAAVRGAGMTTSEDGVRLALSRGTRDGQFVKLARARYRRLAETVQEVDPAAVPADRPAANRKLKPCGTMAAYHRHNRFGEQACALCTEAHRVYIASRRARKAG